MNFSPALLSTRWLCALLAPFTERAVDRSVAERAGQVRRLTGTRIADALIAATALQYELVLVTRNIRHFERILGLELEPSGDR